MRASGRARGPGAVGASPSFGFLLQDYIISPGVRRPSAHLYSMVRFRPSMYPVSLGPSSCGIFNLADIGSGSKRKAQNEQMISELPPDSGHPPLGNALYPGRCPPPRYRDEQNRDDGPRLRGSRCHTAPRCSGVIEPIQGRPLRLTCDVKNQPSGSHTGARAIGVALIKCTAGRRA